MAANRPGTLVALATVATRRPTTPPNPPTNSDQDLAQGGGPALPLPGFDDRVHGWQSKYARDLRAELVKEIDGRHRKTGARPETDDGQDDRNYMSELELWPQ